MHSIQVVETFVISWISAKMNFMRGVLLWAYYTHHFTQKQSQAPHNSNTYQTNWQIHGKQQLGLLRWSEISLCSQNSLVNLNQFWLRLLLHSFNHDIKIWGNQRYYKFSAKIYLAFRFPLVPLLTEHKLGVSAKSLPAKLESMTGIAECLHFNL